MQAVVLKESETVEVQEVENPSIQSPGDVIVRITTTGICGADLHMYRGRTNPEWGTVMGHENMGVIEEVGPGVVSLKKGDRVVMPFNVACGFCFNCVRGYTGACLTTNPEQAGASYGYVNMGSYAGGQAQYLRVPFGDFNCLKLPGTPGDQWEDDFLLLSDVFPTAYHGTELAQVGPGDSVAVFGDGPIGLTAAYCCILRGAGEVYVVGDNAERLQKATDIGATAIDYSTGDPVQQIRDHRRKNQNITGGWRPGEEKMSGVNCGIDAVGYQAKGTPGGRADAANTVLEQLIELVNPTGHLGIIGAYAQQDPGAGTEDERQGRLLLSYGKLWEKGITMGTGQTDVKRYQTLLRDLIVSGRAKPSFVVTQRLPLTEAPDAYQKFMTHESGYTKVVLKPEMAMAGVNG